MNRSLVAQEVRPIRLCFSVEQMRSNRTQDPVRTELSPDPIRSLGAIAHPKCIVERMTFVSATFVQRGKRRINVQNVLASEMKRESS